MTNTAKGKIECRQHGLRELAFVCQHLVSGAGQGFHWTSGDEPDALWPDAWCDACQERCRSHGEQHGEPYTFVVEDVRLVCDGCYDEIRARNWKQDDEAFFALLAEAESYLDTREAALHDQYQLGSYSRYDWSQDTGQLMFSNDGQPKVVADVQFVGSLSTRSQTWLWSWANQSAEESVTQAIRRVRAYGEAHRYLKLVAARWSAEEVDGWEMSAIACYLLQAEGVYRAPDDRGFTFLVMTRVVRTA